MPYRWYRCQVCKKTYSRYHNVRRGKCPDCGGTLAVTDAPYGYCPVCGGKGRFRERRPGGNDICENGHEYPRTQAVGGP